MIRLGLGAFIDFYITRRNGRRTVSIELVGQLGDDSLDWHAVGPQSSSLLYPGASTFRISSTPRPLSSKDCET